MFREQQIYQSIYDIFEDMVNHEFILEMDDKQRESCTTALTNAIFPEIANRGDIELYKDYQAIQKINDCLESGGNITTLRICSDCINHTLKNNSLYSDLWRSFFKFYSNRIIASPDINKRITELEDMKRKSPHRIALRICKVLVKYNVLNKDAGSTKRYVLKNEEGRPIDLEDRVMLAIYDVLQKLGIKHKIRKNECIKLGFLEDEKEKKEMWEKNLRINKIKNLLRSNDKKDFINPITDAFDYKDINDRFLGDFNIT